MDPGIKGGKRSDSFMPMNTSVPFFFPSLQYQELLVLTPCSPRCLPTAVPLGQRLRLPPDRDGLFVPLDPQATRGVLYWLR